MWTITKTQDEGAWLDDYISEVLSRKASPLPDHDTWVGHVEVHWHQTGPGEIYLASNPDQGSVADRLLAEQLVWTRLANRGFKRAPIDVGLTVTSAAWGVSDNVQEKAKRLVQSGAVKLDLNSQGTTMAHVQGDGTDNNGTPDTHQVEIRRQDPANPQKVTGAFCDCTWGQFLNTPRTRQWKQYQKIPCAHIIATSWVSQSVPTEEQRAPGDYGEQGQMALPGMGGGPAQAPGSMGLMRQGPGAGPQPNAQMPQNGAPGAAPPPEDVLPQFPMAEGPPMPQVNPASTPGGRPGPTPTNPMQYPGGTFSSVRSAVEFRNGDSVTFTQEVLGQMVGRSDQHGAGQQIRIPAGEGGEVLGTDPSTGMVEVLSMDKSFAPMGKMQPFGARVWCWPSELKPSGVRAPAPNVRRV